MFLVGEIVLFGIIGEGRKRCKSKEGSLHRYAGRSKGVATAASNVAFLKEKERSSSSDPHFNQGRDE